MIVGTITLLTILFGGGLSEIFFVDQLEKGVKEYVIEKDIKKEILEDLKQSKALIKEFQKEMKNERKVFDALYLDYECGKEELTTFFEDVYAKNITMQRNNFEKRIEVAAKISQVQWDSIMIYSERSYETKLEIKRKKTDKALKNAGAIFSYARTYEEIKNTGITNSHQLQFRKQLDEIHKNLEAIEKALRAINVKDNEVLSTKDSDLNELTQMMEIVNRERSTAYQLLINFHISLKTEYSKDEFQSIIKVFLKEMEVPI